MTGAMRTIPMARLDRINRGHHLVGVVGPIEVPSREEFVAALRRIAAVGPQARLGLQFGGREGTWRYDPAGLDELCESIVSTTTEPAMDYARRIMPAVAGRGREARPVEFVLAGDYIVTIFDHGLGDGPIMELLPAAVVAIARGAGIPDVFQASRMSGALRAALLGTYLRHPTAVPRTLAARRAASRPALPQATPVPAAVPPEPVPSFHYARSTAAQLRELKQLTRAGSAPVSLTALLMSLLARSIQREGAAVAPDGVLVLDSRRYLPEGANTLGNFITGMPVGLTDTEPAVISSQIDSMLGSGWPLATLTMGALQAGAPPAPPVPVDPGSPVRLSLSNAGLLRRFGELPWLPGGERVALFAVGPVPDRQFSVSVMAVGQELHFTASFNAAMLAPGFVAAVLERVVREPATLLERDERG